MSGIQSIKRPLLLLIRLRDLGLNGCPPWRRRSRFSNILVHGSAAAMVHSIVAIDHLHLPIVDGI